MDTFGNTGNLRVPVYVFLLLKALSFHYRGRGTKSNDVL